MIPWATLALFAVAGGWLGGFWGIVAGVAVGVAFDVAVGSLTDLARRRRQASRANLLLDRWRHAHPPPTLRWRPMKVRVDFLPGVYDAYARPLSWGYYARPYFPAQEAARVAADLARAGGWSRYDALLDSYFVRAPEELGETQARGQRREIGILYDFGGGYWPWREVPRARRD